MLSDLKHISPSQIQLFEACPRKWWWRYIIRVPSIPTYAQTTGTSIHQKIEDYYQKGVVPDDERVESALRHIPEPSEDLLVEQGLSIIVPELSVPLLGYADLIDLSGAFPKLYDFKSSSNIRRWAKTKRELSENIQLNFYAYIILTELAPDADSIEMSHVYIQSRGAAKTKKVSATVSRGHVEGQWEAILDSCKRMLELQCEEFQQNVPQDVTACGDYGGCDFRNHCIGSKKYGGRYA